MRDNGLKFKWALQAASGITIQVTASAKRRDACSRGWWAPAGSGAAAVSAALLAGLLAVLPAARAAAQAAARPNPAQALLEHGALAMRTDPEISRREADITASVGVTVSVPGKDTPSTMLQRADFASYAAKRSGRNCVRTEPALAPDTDPLLLNTQAQ